ncbi:hypothetical protein TNCV_1753401 [Trichonephila clavipes]|nr:hypothetical protein TNCV_1753401 [Trichonephila clavipes]
MIREWWTFAPEPPSFPWKTPECPTIHPVDDLKSKHKHFITFWEIVLSHCLGEKCRASGFCKLKIGKPFAGARFQEAGKFQEHTQVKKTGHLSYTSFGSKLGLQ